MVVIRNLPLCCWLKARLRAYVLAFNSNSRIITIYGTGSHIGLQALFGFLGKMAKNNNALLVYFLGTFSASLCKLNGAQMNNEDFGWFSFTIATAKVLFLLVHNQLPHNTAEVGTKQNKAHGQILRFHGNVI